ncbi:hypothetical protein ACP4OV_008687 [Aristida adscensionis]
MLSVVNVLPRQRQRQAIARFAVSALVASLPLLYVSLLRPPPAALAGDTAFWFLMSNCVVAAIVAADNAGALFVGSKQADHPYDDGGGGRVSLSYAISDDGDHPTVAAVAGSPDAIVSSAASRGVPPAVSMTRPRVQEQMSIGAATISSDAIDHAFPLLIKGEEEDGDAAASKPVTGMDKIAVEPTGTDCNNAVAVAGLGGEQVDGELAIVRDDGALADEPVLVRSKSLVEEVQEDESSDGPADDVLLLDTSVVGAAGVGKLRRSATEGSKPAAAEESEYWELSDEELNRRVEDFIARFNREMRLQIQQEAAAV